MDNQYDRRECFEFDEEEVLGMNRRKDSCDEEKECHHKERDYFTKALEEAFNEGYKKGYCEGYEEGYEKGYTEGYCEGLKDGYEKAKQEILCFMKKRNRCCCKPNRCCRRFKCC